MLSSTVTNSVVERSIWQWKSWNGLSYLTCSLLENWQHGFFTQQFSPRLPEALVEVIQCDARVYRVRQVHGNRVLTSKEIEAESQHLPEGEDKLSAADGIISDRPQESVWVASADCTPALIGDLETGRVAAVHAGWRGTAQRIIPETIACFLDRGSDVKNLRVALGPAIAGDVYQVSQQVAAEVGASLIPAAMRDVPESILEALQTMPDSPIADDPHPGRVRLDVRRVNVLQSEQLGLSREQIAVAPYCTYQQAEHFFSYRRTKQKQVQWSGIASKSNG